VAEAAAAAAAAAAEAVTVTEAAPVDAAAVELMTAAEVVAGEVKEEAAAVNTISQLMRMNRYSYQDSEQDVSARDAERLVKAQKIHRCHRSTTDPKTRARPWQKKRACLEERKKKLMLVDDGGGLTASIPEEEGGGGGDAPPKDQAKGPLPSCLVTPAEQAAFIKDHTVEDEHGVKWVEWTTDEFDTHYYDWDSLGLMGGQLSKDPAIWCCSVDVEVAGGNWVEGLLTEVVRGASGEISSCHKGEFQNNSAYSVLLVQTLETKWVQGSKLKQRARPLPEVIIEQDETICKSNQDQKQGWRAPGAGYIKPKSEGAGLMISGYRAQNFGFFTLTRTEVKEFEQLRAQRRVHSEAQAQAPV
jgi:hypothetical protein